MRINIISKSLYRLNEMQPILCCNLVKEDTHGYVVNKGT